MPFILPEDRPFVEELGAKGAVTHDWNSSIADPAFGHPSDRRFHLGLLPIPFVGSLTTASVYVLLLNPGLGPHDYFGEYEVPAYRRALLSSLKQEAGNAFLFLDPQFSWHGGFDYWHGKFASLIEELTRREGTSFASARSRLARALACIELIPYHSPSFRDPGRWVENLPSAQLARQFVQEVVVQRVQDGQAVVVVARKSKVWDLPKHEGIVTYDGVEARAAHLTPNSRGGRLILDHLSSVRDRA